VAWNDPRRSGDPTPAGPLGALVRDLREALGPSSVRTEPELVAAHATDWTGRFAGQADAVVRPSSTAEAAAVVEAARAHGVALVPQGGNTGLVGGAVPDPGAAVVDLRALDTIHDLDPDTGQATVGAGVTLAALQAAAADAGWAYGIDFGARDSATIGGSIATNAAGLRFVRHGDTRAQLLGVEAVLGTGSVISHLPRVAKDNTGYDLAALLCGSEGTLGLVTGARVRLVAPRRGVIVALVAVRGLAEALAGAQRLRRALPLLEAAEVVRGDGLALVLEATGAEAPWPTVPGAALLVEVAEPTGVEALAAAVADLAGVVDVSVATDAARARHLWRLREAHTEAIARRGPVHKYDVSLPLDAAVAVVEEVERALAARAPGAHLWVFGHGADGNLHLNVTGVPVAPTASAGDGPDGWLDDLVLGAVARADGSISAEHGIGRAKRRWLHLARSPEEIGAMRAVKAALDPDEICNPGVLLP
jgi:FAD/FMN-containing dehydrogenase